MTMPEDVALWLQKDLRTLAIDDYGLVLFAHGNLDRMPGYSTARWQFAVDAIYRTIKCNLVAVHKFVECHDEDSFFKAICTLSPYRADGAVLWNGTLIYGTEKLDALVGSFFPAASEGRDKLNLAFIEALEHIFVESGVPWSEQPLLPIAPASAEASAPR